MSTEPDPGSRADRAVTAFAVGALRAGTITEIMALAVQAVADAVAAPACALVRLTEDGRAVVVHTEGDGGRTARPAGPRRTPFRRPPTRGTPSRPAELTTPVTVEGRLWGMLHATDPGREAFTADDERAAASIAEILGAAVDRDRDDARQASLLSLHLVAARAPHLTEMMTHTLDAVVVVTGLPTGAVVRQAVPPTRLAVVQATEDSGILPGQHYDVEPCLAEVFGGTERLVVRDCSTDARFRRPPLPGLPSVGACLAVSLPLDARPWGRLLVVAPGPHDFTEGEVDFATSAAGVLTDVLQRKRDEWSRAGKALIDAARSWSGPDVTTEVALLDRSGVIVWVNQAWRRFAEENGGDPGRTGVGVSYLSCCDRAADPGSAAVAHAIREALAGGLPAPLRLLLPCHAPQEERWFDVLVSSRLDDGGACLGAAVTLSRAP